MVFNEMYILKDLDHPGIMKLHEIFQEKDKLIIIMEYVPGGTLYSYFRQKKKLSERTAANLLKNIAEALHEMHRYTSI
jgi:death-associated protein kinase